MEGATALTEKIITNTVLQDWWMSQTLSWIWACFIFILDVPVHTYSEEYIEESKFSGLRLVRHIEWRNRWLHGVIIGELQAHLSDLK